MYSSCLRVCVLRSSVLLKEFDLSRSIRIIPWQKCKKGRTHMAARADTHAHKHTHRITASVYIYIYMEHAEVAQRCDLSSMPWCIAAPRGRSFSHRDVPRVRAMHSVSRSVQQHATHDVYSMSVCWMITGGLS